MIKGTTENGFEYQLDDDVMDDYELLEALVEVDKGDSTMIIKAANILLGEEQMKRLKDHIRGTGKRVSAVKLIQTVSEIIVAVKSGKN